MLIDGAAVHLQKARSHVRGADRGVSRTPRSSADGPHTPEADPSVARGLTMAAGRAPLRAGPLRRRGRPLSIPDPILPERPAASPV